MSFGPKDVSLKDVWDRNRAQAEVCWAFLVTNPSVRTLAPTEFSKPTCAKLPRPTSATGRICNFVFYFILFYNKLAMSYFIFSSHFVTQQVGSPLCSIHFLINKFAISFLIFYFHFVMQQVCNFVSSYFLFILLYQKFAPLLCLIFLLILLCNKFAISFEYLIFIFLYKFVISYFKFILLFCHFVINKLAPLLCPLLL